MKTSRSARGEERAGGIVEPHSNNLFAGEHSQTGREVRIPQRACFAEEKSLGFSPDLLVALFVALGGENSFVRRPCGAMRKRAMGGERELRLGNVRRCGAKRRRSHWPSTTGTDPVASSGVPPAMALDCKPVRGSNTGVGVSVGGNVLSTSLPLAAFASSLPVRPLLCALRGAVWTDVRPQTPPTVRARTIAAPVTRIVLGVGVACKAAAEADLLQLSMPVVLESVGCAGLAMSSLVLRVAPAGGERVRS
eukprot:6172840-Pleurochrysis_carterae.AAC.3